MNCVPPKFSLEASFVNRLCLYILLLVLTFYSLYKILFFVLKVLSNEILVKCKIYVVPLKVILLLL